MIKFEFVFFEVLAMLLFAACLWHASHQGGYRVLELLASLLYGVFLEWMTINQMQAYQYGRFMVMIDSAPLCIGLGWAVIIYSSMEFVKNLSMPDFARPFLVGLMALNIDAGMDAVAIRLKFWQWVIPLDKQWFGVPWGNFWAWFIVVTSFSGLIYWFRSRGWHLGKSLWQKWTYPVFTLAGSVLILAGTNLLFMRVFASSDLGSAASMLVLVYTGIFIVLSVRPRFIAAARLDWVVFAVPLAFHLFFNLFGFLYGIYPALPALAVTGLLMLVTGLSLHLWPWYLGLSQGSPKQASKG